MLRISQVFLAFDPSSSVCVYTLTIRKIVKNLQINKNLPTNSEKTWNPDGIKTGSLTSSEVDIFDDFSVT